MIESFTSVSPAYHQPLLLLAGLVNGIVATYAWRQRHVAGGRYFVLLVSTLAVWSALNAIWLSVESARYSEIFATVDWFVAIVTATWLFAFAIKYTGRVPTLSHRQLALLLLVPAVTVVVATTNDGHQLMWTSYTVTTESGVAISTYRSGAWQLVAMGYAYTLIVAGLLVLSIDLITTDRYYLDQWIALALGIALPLVTHVLYHATSYPTWGNVDPTPYVFTATGVLFGHGIYRYDLLAVVPAIRAIGERTVIDDLDVGVVIVDSTGRIQSLNPAAGRLIDGDRTDIIGRPLESVLDIEYSDREFTTRVQTPTGMRTYNILVSDLESTDSAAKALTFNDVSDRVQHEQRLDVLDRLLRHNLRNDVNVILGVAEGVRDGTLPPEEASTIIEVSRDLIDLTEKARAVDRRLDARATEGNRTELGSFAREIVAMFQNDHPDSEITLDQSLDRPVHYDERLLALILENLLENALEHMDAEMPRVTVSISDNCSDPLPVAIEITDNGPGISPLERQPIDSRDESTLSHTSGIGLWAVAWGVDQLGGTVTFEDAAPAGTTVVVRLPHPNRDPNNGHLIT